ncbi:S9 family peptidase [Streptomyces candidus]|uniref:Dipeptidyl aminopeptidase/acylaminoacyl peptidase n=1 Tax=Streptomyces candidus TaxID=67283 RepID=A0A7X0HM78_9ACTN|nr:S9 family peptidase [Streptomyces candidus]MBB6438713.1 dipeptidyl aminopeptidase/acylaminoacyl peptidase [Streptomyces candidus]GHH53270.1 peptidase S9 [Streptomyces candidus]
MPTTPSGRTAFHDLSTFLATSRVSSLALSPDGSRLVAAVQDLNGEGTAYVSGLWEIDPAGKREPHRLTRSVTGESAPAFAADGTLFFLSGRGNTDPGADKAEDKDGATLWALPERGEAVQVVRHYGGISGYALAARGAALAYTAQLLPGAADAQAHAERSKERAEAKVTAVLYEAGPTRFWDHDLGPAEPHALVRRLADDGMTAEEATVDAGSLGAIADTETALSPDGSRVALVRFVPGDVPNGNRTALVVADAATGEELHVLDHLEHDYHEAVFSADGRSLVCLRQLKETYETPYDMTLVRVDVASGEETDLLPDFDNWPSSVAVSPVEGDATVWFTADELGRAPIFRRDPDGTVTRLTAHGAYASVQVAPDAATLYALRTDIDAVPAPVRLAAAGADQSPEALRAPGAIDAFPGTLTEVHTEGDDGFPLRGWLAVPKGASADAPAPLLVFVHGGPQGSWNAWTWRWNPWPFVARGYAVLMPDPALSTGYGQQMHERGWGQWGGRPYEDLMRLTDATAERPEIDRTRTGLAGGSYGGYMANRVATSTDRFKGIVSHAGLWDLRSFQGDTDASWFFRRIFGDPLSQPQRYEENSPAPAVQRVRTPMLVVHGAKDYRVPVGQAMALFQDLQRCEVPVRFLYFPDENHWVLKPRHAQLWYETVLNFFDERVLGKDWVRPGLV